MSCGDYKSVLLLAFYNYLAPIILLNWPLWGLFLRLLSMLSHLVQLDIKLYSWVNFIVVNIITQ